MAETERYPHYIEFRHVHKTFDRPVLVDSNFHVNAGETVAIIGRSGVGKSVTLSHSWPCRSARRLCRWRRRGPSGSQSRPGTSWP